MGSDEAYNFVFKGESIYSSIDATLCTNRSSPSGLDRFPFVMYNVLPVILPSKFSSGERVAVPQGVNLQLCYKFSIMSLGKHTHIAVLYGWNQDVYLSTCILLYSMQSNTVVQSISFNLNSRCLFTVAFHGFSLLLLTCISYWFSCSYIPCSYMIWLWSTLSCPLHK